MKSPEPTTFNRGYIYLMVPFMCCTNVLFEKNGHQHKITVFNTKHTHTTKTFFSYFYKHECNVHI